MHHQSLEGLLLSLFCREAPPAHICRPYLIPSSAAVPCCTSSLWPTLGCPWYVDISYRHKFRGETTVIVREARLCSRFFEQTHFSHQQSPHSPSRPNFTAVKSANSRRSKRRWSVDFSALLEKIGWLSVRDDQWWLSWRESRKPCLIKDTAIIGPLETNAAITFPQILLHKYACWSKWRYVGCCGSLV